MSAPTGGRSALLATGFDAVSGNLVRIDIRGRDGESLAGMRACRSHVKFTDISFLAGKPGWFEARRLELTAAMIRVFKHYIPHAVILLGLLDLVLLLAGEIAWQLRAAQLAMDPGALSGRFLSLLSFPLIALFAVLVKLDSRGPAFFRQTRVGLYGQDFELIKLRSMRLNAEKPGEAKWAQSDDPRITRIGRFIRKARIDELPQVWSVLKGEMSFVGPRPERPQFVSDLEEQLPYYAERHMVKPDITGWAQINYPYGASMDDSRQKLEYDFYYAKNYTPFPDLLILLQTIRVVLWNEGAR